jgi:hypothetical protein
MFRCEAKTKLGFRCKNISKNKYCNVHIGFLKKSYSISYHKEFTDDQMSLLNFLWEKTLKHPSTMKPSKNMDLKYYIQEYIYYDGYTINDDALKYVMSNWPDRGVIDKLLENGIQKIGNTGRKITLRSLNN